jgi:hypothetical protein
MNAQPSYTALLEPRLRSFPQPQSLKASYESLVPTVVGCDSDGCVLRGLFFVHGACLVQPTLFFDRLFLIKMNRDRS